MGSVDDVFKKFDEWCIGSKKEIFRLQLLNTYDVESSKKSFEDYRRGKPINIDEIPGYKDWLSRIETKKKQGVRVINMQVVDLPLNDYTRYAVEVILPINERAGQESYFIERSKAADTVSGFQDFWMFDSEKVLLMDYDKNGRFLGGRVLTDTLSIARYVKLKHSLSKIAAPMKEFLQTKEAKAHRKTKKLS